MAQRGNPPTRPTTTTTTTSTSTTTRPVGMVDSPLCSPVKVGMQVSVESGSNCAIKFRLISFQMVLVSAAIALLLLAMGFTVWVATQHVVRRVDRDWTWDPRSPATRRRMRPSAPPEEDIEMQPMQAVVTEQPRRLQPELPRLPPRPLTSFMERRVR